MKTIKAIAVLITLNLPSAYSSDWPEWGGDEHNNMASTAKGIPLEMEPGKRKKGTEEIDLCNQLVRNYYATEHLSIVNGIKVPSTQPVRLNISILTISQDPNLSAEGSIQSRLIPPGGPLSFSNSDQSFTFGILNQEDDAISRLLRIVVAILTEGIDDPRTVRQPCLITLRKCHSHVGKTLVVET